MVLKFAILSLMISMSLLVHSEEDDNFIQLSLHHEFLSGQAMETNSDIVQRGSTLVRGAFEVGREFSSQKYRLSLGLSSLSIPMRRTKEAGGHFDYDVEGQYVFMKFGYAFNLKKISIIPKLSIGKGAFSVKGDDGFKGDTDEVLFGNIGVDAKFTLSRDFYFMGGLEYLTIQYSEVESDQSSISSSEIEPSLNIGVALGMSS